MQRKNRLFTNLFNSKEITPARLLAFARFVIAALTTLDASAFAALIEALREAAGKLSGELSEVKTNLQEQKENTLDINAFVANLHAYMRDHSLAIASAFGGYATAGYRAFYPNGITGYSEATLTDMETITKGLTTALQKWGKQLPAEIANALAAFEPDFMKARNSQQAQKTAVGNDRTGRNDAGTALQLVLTTAVHTVAAAYPGNEAVGNKTFPMEMLYAKTRRRHVVLEGSLAPHETKEVQNYRLTAKVRVLIANTGTTSDLLVWLAPQPGTAAPATTLRIAPGDSKEVAAPKLGSLENTFLMVANNSTVNTGSYRLEITGMKKEKKPAEPKEGGDMEVRAAFVSHRVLFFARIMKKALRRMLPQGFSIRTREGIVFSKNVCADKDETAHVTPV